MGKCKFTKCLVDPYIDICCGDCSNSNSCEEVCGLDKEKCPGYISNDKDNIVKNEGDDCMEKKEIYETAFNLIKDSFSWAGQYKEGEHVIFIDGVMCMANNLICRIDGSEECEDIRPGVTVEE